MKRVVRAYIDAEVEANTEDGLVAKAISEMVKAAPSAWQFVIINNEEETVNNDGE